MIAAPEKSVFARIVEASKIQPSPELAEIFLQWQFTEEDHNQMEMLAAKSNEGTLTEQERRLLAEYSVVGNLLALLHLRARKVLGLPLRK